MAGLCQQTFHFCSADVLLLAELAQKFELLWNSCMAKWFHKTELQGIYLYLFNQISIGRGLIEMHHCDAVLASYVCVYDNAEHQRDKKASYNDFHISWLHWRPYTMVWNKVWRRSQIFISVKSCSPTWLVFLIKFSKLLAGTFQPNDSDLAHRFE